MIQLFVYVPESHLEQVKSAMFAAGAGRSKFYDQCAWVQPGQGQFMPLEGSHPHVGEINKLTRTQEYKIEMICNEEDLSEVVNAMKLVHPYEQPAYGALALLNI